MRQTTQLDEELNRSTELKTDYSKSELSSCTATTEKFPEGLRVGITVVGHHAENDADIDDDDDDDDEYYQMQLHCDG
eukprot:scaffold40697_cov199-Amphora_coffeaeformis.AAC.1